MKKSIFTKMGAAAMVLTLVTASLVGGTFARYTSTVTGEGNAAVAKWAIEMKNNDAPITGETFSFDLANTSDAKTADKKIAPGSSGEISFAISGNGSEVGYHYTIEADIAGLAGIPLTFYKTKSADGTYTDALAVEGNKATLASDDVTLASVATEQSAKVYWVWADANTSDGNVADTGFSGKTGKIAITMTAEQLMKEPVQQ